MRKHGRKLTLKYSTIPWIIGWATLSASYDFWTIFIGSGLVGFSSGFNNNAVLVYATEIAEPKLRGFLVSFTQTSFAAGIFIGQLLGVLLQWRIALGLYAIFPALCLFFSFFLQESPNWLMIEGRVEEASKNYFWLRGLTEESQREYYILQEKRSENTTKHKRGLFKNLFSRQFFHPCLIMVVMFGVTVGSGIDMLLFYTMDILEPISRTISPSSILVMIDAMRLMSTAVSSVLIKGQRRKPLFFLSALCTLLFLMGTVASLHYNLSNLLLALNLGLYVGAANIGMVPISWVMIAEVRRKIIINAVVFCIARMLNMADINFTGISASSTRYWKRSRAHLRLFFGVRSGRSKPHRNKPVGFAGYVMYFWDLQLRLHGFTLLHYARNRKIYLTRSRGQNSANVKTNDYSNA